MYKYDRRQDFHDRSQPGWGDLPRLNAKVLLPLIVPYGLGFALLYPAAKASASKSAAEGNDPMAFIGP